jgi:hypothetical protein
MARFHAPGSRVPTRPHGMLGQTPLALCVQRWEVGGASSALRGEHRIRLSAKIGNVCRLNKTRIPGLTGFVLADET